MSIEVKVPLLPESVADATIATWHKKPGDSVKRDENLVDLETDKVVLEVPASSDGILQEIRQPEGSVVKAGEVIAILTVGSASTSVASPSQEKKDTSDSKNKTPDITAGPSARRSAAEHELPLENLKGSGKNGRIVREDVLATTKSSMNINSTTSNQLTVQANRLDKRVPMTRLRARIAERLLSAQQNAALLTTFNEVNLQRVMDLRTTYKDGFEKKHGVRLGFMSFFTKAVVEALKRYPAVNASIDGNDIVYHQYFDIGIAVSSERGLVVPVVRDVDTLSFAEIENAIATYGRKAREGQITMEDMNGGTFTITNGGVFGSLLSMPIINPPQSAILGMNKIEERPVVEKGQIVIRPMMYVALTYDHRIIDGKESVGFLVAVKEFLEDPSRLLLGV